MLNDSPERLFQRAQSRVHRDDFGDTARWVYPGSSKRVLLIHGFRGDHHGLQALAGALPDYEITIPDLPGFGKSGPLPTHDLDSYGSWLVKFHSDTGPYDLVVGHSFGTLVVANAMSKSLDQRLVCLINPISTRASNCHDAANRIARLFYRFGENRFIGDWLLRSGLITRAMSIGLSKSKSLRTRRFVHDQHAKYFSGFHDTKSVTEGFLAASSGSVFDYTQDLTSLTLLIAGEKDSVAPIAAQHQFCASLQNAELEIIPGVGHLTHYEKPVEVASRIADFLGGNS